MDERRNARLLAGQPCVGRAARPGRLRFGGRQAGRAITSCLAGDGQGMLQLHNSLILQILNKKQRLLHNNPNHPCE
jgi:hypothetical protein